MARRLPDKRALITGAASGVGRATAVRFAQEGAVVGLVDRDEDALHAVGREITAAGGRADVLVADVTDEAALGARVASFGGDGGLDIVVANAAVQLFGRDAAAADLELDVWQQTMDVNLTGAFLTCKHGIRAMLAAGRRGSVVCTASPTGLRGSAPGFDAYSTSKAGVIGLVRVLAADYGRHGIRVNAVVPGYTETPLVRSVAEDDTARRAVLERVPLGRPGTVEEVAAAMLFLASDEASYATGSILAVDGGATAT